MPRDPQNNPKREHWEARWAQADFRMAWMTQEIPPLVTELLNTGKLTSQDRLLDIGCGSGELALGLARAGIEIVGVDFSDTAILKAREAGHYFPDLRLKFQVGDFCDPNFRLGKFSWLIDRGCLHVIPDDQKQAYFNNAARGLSANGSFLIFHKSNLGDKNNAISLDSLKKMIATYGGQNFELITTKPYDFSEGKNEKVGFALYLKRSAT
ncbi:MAG: methyltransferase domain-containing protein [Hellea sp.]|nr:methyltransferase domain-containing protein [Hellea sp.]